MLSQKADYKKISKNMCDKFSNITDEKKIESKFRKILGKYFITKLDDLDIDDRLMTVSLS